MMVNEKIFNNDDGNGVLCRTEVFEDVFDGLENILAKMLSDIIEVDYDELKDKVLLKGKDEEYSNAGIDEKIFIISLEHNCLLKLEDCNGKNIMFLYLNSSNKCDDASILLKPLIRIYFKNDLDKNNWQNNLLISLLNIDWCKSIYDKELNRDVPCFIRWGALFYSNDILVISEIIKEIMSFEEQELFINHLKRYL